MTSVKGEARRFYAVLDSQDWSALAKLVSPNVVSQLGSSPPIGFAEWQELLRGFYIGFPDGHHVIDDYLVDGDRVVTRCRFEGTHAGVFQGLQPSAKPVSVGVIHIDRFRDGKLVEHFGQLDAVGLSRQIGGTG